MADIIFLYCTAPDPETAERIADDLIGSKYAACVNIHAPMRSVYAWEGAVEKAAETPFIVKCAKDRADAARDRIIALHPYDCPCVAAIPIDGAHSSAAFLEWVGAATTL